MPAYVPAAGALTTKLVSLFPLNDGHRDPDPSGPDRRVRPRRRPAGRAARRHPHHRGAHGGRLGAVRPPARSRGRLHPRDPRHRRPGTRARARCRPRPSARRDPAGRPRSRAHRGGGGASWPAELDRPVVPCSTYAEALDGAGIVCACTHAVEPVVRRDWLAPGAHVTSVGYNPDGREVDDATVADALVVVESRASALAPIPAGTPDLTEPIARRADRPRSRARGDRRAGGRHAPGPRRARARSRSTSRSAWRCRTPRRPRWCSRPRASREWGPRSTI